ncbi:hypothetical protein BC936DRAFT_147561 [Jimgerdemannia flammicorona]|uniref:Uncharacterized protein n=1 Tax=Jimgerdemannia flammicorona TaxID=994334 RepID=A0A433D559_9FUNG|nr:hypothetical protein BC936DRAFT_147561 [Jimgerdemannia flammicorona]
MAITPVFLTWLEDCAYAWTENTRRFDVQVPRKKKETSTQQTADVTNSLTYSGITLPYPSQTSIPDGVLVRSTKPRARRATLMHKSLLKIT